MLFSRWLSGYLFIFLVLYNICNVLILLFYSLTVTFFKFLFNCFKFPLFLHNVSLRKHVTVLSYLLSCHSSRRKRYEVIMSCIYLTTVYRWLTGNLTQVEFRIWHALLLPIPFSPHPDLPSSTQKLPSPPLEHPLTILSHPLH